MFLFSMRISRYLISLSQHFTCSLINLPFYLAATGPTGCFQKQISGLRVYCRDLFKSTCGRESRLSETAVLTAFDLQGAVLLVQRVAAQVHHAGCGCGDPTTQSGMEDIYIYIYIGFIKEPVRGSHRRPRSFHLTFSTEYDVHVKAG